MGAAACFSVYTFDLHHPDVGGRDSAALLQVHPLFEFSVFLVHKCFGNFIVIIHNCIGIVFDLPFLRVGNGVVVCDVDVSLLLCFVCTVLPAVRP